MTVSELITEVDALEPNQYNIEFKIRWLSDLDGQIFDEMIITHIPDIRAKLRERPAFYGNPLNQEKIWPFEPIEQKHEHGGHKPEKRRWPYTDGTEELLVKEPYARDVYVPYLEAMIARANKEFVRYNAMMTLYNAGYQKWAAWFNRTYYPVPPKGGDRWKL